MAAIHTLDPATRNRQQIIISAVAGEIERQKQRAGAKAPITADLAPTELYVEGTLDLQLIAEAVERALDGLPGLSPDAPVDEGTPPQELNSSNDG